MLCNKSIFITGANRGIGFELVKESLNNNAFVFGTFRNKLKAKELYLIKSHNFNAFQMNVINEASIIEVSDKLTKPIDFLICNAGINNGFGNFFDEDHSHEKMLEVLNVNVLGCILTIRNLRKNLNNNARIILISSILGIQQHSGATATIYRASKAAVNNVMVSVSEEFKSENITVVSFHPGWVRTEMGGVNATLSAKDSAKELIKSFEKLSFKDTGKFFNYDGTMIKF